MPFVSNIHHIWIKISANAYGLQRTWIITNIQLHTQTVQCQSRAFSVDELSWSQTFWLSFCISCKRWIRFLYNCSHAEAQCNKVNVCVGVLDRRGHILKWLNTATVPPVRQMWYVYFWKLPISVRDLEECALRETTGTAYTAF